MIRTISIGGKFSAIVAVLTLVTQPLLETVRAQTSTHLNEVPRETIEARLRGFSARIQSANKVLRLRFKKSAAETNI